MSDLLSGIRVLVLEDEFLIAMDVEQLCRDHGAAEVAILGHLDGPEPQTSGAGGFDVAILDVMLGGHSTLDFAARLAERNVPFVFSSGYTDLDEIYSRFPGVTVIGKPYHSEDLIKAVARACGRL